MIRTPGWGALALLCLSACGEGQDSAQVTGGPEGPGGEGLRVCPIVEDVLVLPHDGACRLSTEQRALYRLSGAEPACSGGLVELGGLSGPRVSLNGLQVRCAPSAEEAPPPPTPVDLNPDPGPGLPERPAPVDPVMRDVQRLAPGDWLQFEDGFSAGCDLVHGADFAAVVRGDGGGALVVVSEAGADVTDFTLPGLVLDESYDAYSPASQAPVARLRYQYDADGGRNLWLVRPDGSPWRLGVRRFPDLLARDTPRTRPGVACQACEQVDGADPSSCAAAVAQVLPSEGISPAQEWTPRSGVLTTETESRLIEWAELDSQLGTTCGLIHGVDFRVGLQGDTFAPVPDTPDGPVPRFLLGYSLAFFPFSNVERGGTWHLFPFGAPPSLSRTFGAPLGEIVFAEDSAAQLRLWLLASDGSILNQALEASSARPEELDPVACDPCSFFAQSGGTCLPSAP